jgi:hypothetical protein
MWPFKTTATNTTVRSASVPLTSSEFEELLKRISLLKADVLELQSATTKQAERLASLAGKLYASQPAKEPEEKASNSTEPKYL